MYKMKKFIKKNFLFIVPAVLFMQAFLLVIYCECVTFYDFSIPYRWVDLNNLYFIFYNMAIYIPVALMLFCMTKRLFPGYVISFIYVTLFSIVGNMKWNQLKEGVSFADLEKLSEAVKVGKDAEFLGISRLMIGIAAFIVLGIWVFLFDKYGLENGDEQYQGKWRAFHIASALFFLFFVLFARWDWNLSAMERITESRTADITGPAVYFLESMEKVLCEEKYSVEQARQSYEHYVELGRQLVQENRPSRAEESGQNVTADTFGENGELPNVIVIMSEAFYDVNKFEGVLSYSKDPMADYNELASEGINGSVAVNIYGGSTHYSEFEFLTGWNTRGMSLGACPYKEYFKEFQPSLVKYFKDAGYYVAAIHPYEEWFWNRSGAYNSMGFNVFIGRDDMQYKKMCGYISDESLTQEIIYRYEQGYGTKKPFFCFAVSMANHIALINDDAKENSPEQIEIDFQGNTENYGPNKKRRIVQHVSGMEKSGEALRALADYYKTVEEPTVIVFFGDHAPSYAAEVLEAGALDKEEAYKTPFLIWSNYDMKGLGNSVTDSLITDENKVKLMNVSYLSTYLIDVMGMPFPKQGYYNIGLMSEYPVETRYIIECKNHTSLRDVEKNKRKSYINHAEDMKNSINTLLENPDKIENVWNNEKTDLYKKSNFFP